jgi:hypothetical protein
MGADLSPIRSLDEAGIDGEPDVGREYTDLRPEEPKVAGSDAVLVPPLHVTVAEEQIAAAGVEVVVGGDVPLV